MKPHVYLAGRMTGLVHRGAEWRDAAAVLLSPLVAIDPLKLELPDHDADTIVRTDLNAITDAAAILVYVGIPSWGTAMEIWWAHENMGRGFPIIAWTGPDFDGNLSPWARYCCTEVHETLAEAVNSIREKNLAHL